MKDQKPRELIEGLHPLEVNVLRAFSEGRVIRDESLRGVTGLEPSQLDMALGWLQAKGLLKLVTEEVLKSVSLTEAGFRYSAEKNPELRIIERLRFGEGVTVESLREGGGLEPEELSAAIGALKTSGDIRMAEGGIIQLAGDDRRRQCEELQDLIEKTKKQGSLALENYDSSQGLIERYSRKRGKAKGIFHIHEVKRREYALTLLGEKVFQGLPGGVRVGEEISQITPEMLKDGSWRDKEFRKYNIGLKPPRILVGKKHPYREFLDLVKAKLVAMGFEEMRGPLVETEFWNMDALYMPQFHPARNIHDVYFVRDPQYARSIPEPYLSQVTQTHKSGWKTGSLGWRYAFDVQRARRLVLRSQGTAVSARTLAGQGPHGNPKIPGKYFSMARCFRYEQVDATHACDFFQVEGIVLGEEINFRTLLGLLQLFALEVARTSGVKFLPAYFPFTEPSVELHVQHPKLGWMELGGAGLFRPEVTYPLGVEVPVIAWGLGLDRMAMVALEISDIRDLFSADLDLIRTKRIRTPVEDTKQ